MVFLRFENAILESPGCDANMRRSSGAVLSFCHEFFGRCGVVEAEVDAIDLTAKKMRKASYEKPLRSELSAAQPAVLERYRR